MFRLILVIGIVIGLAVAYVVFGRKNENQTKTKNQNGKRKT